MIENEPVSTAEVVQGPPAPLPGSSRGRWLIGLAVAGAALGLTLVAVLVLGGRQTPEGLSYVPADSVIVAELRLDLPGDQLQKVGNLLAHFPGFADQATLAQKLDEAGDRLVELATNGAVSYTRDLKAWVSGPAYLALLAPVPNPPAGQVPSALFVATTNGAAGCEELFSGRNGASEPYRGLDINVLPDRSAACVEDGRYVIAGDPASVRAGIDARADGSGIDGSARYQAARDALGGERLATVYANGNVIARLGAVAGALPSPGALPDWSIVGIRAEDEALVLDWDSAPLPEPSAGPSPLGLLPTHPSELAKHVPGTAIAYAELQGAGASVVNGLTLLRAEPALSEVLGQLDQLATGFGGVEKLLGWVDDAGVVVVNDGYDVVGDLAGAILLLAPDEATAAARVENVRSLLALAALGGAVELDTTTIDEIEVTVVTLTEAAGLPADQPVQLRVAVAGRLLVIGTTEAVMGLVLATDRERSLAESEAFSRAMARGVPNPRTMLYVSVEHAMAFGRAAMPADEAATFETSVLPYLGPIEAIHMSATDGPEGFRARIVMTVSGPQP